MNAVDARAVEHVPGRWRGEFKKVHRTEWSIVEKKGKPVLFETAAAAETAAWRSLRAHLCGDIVGVGQRVPMSTDLAHVFPGKGRKPVAVVRR